MSNRIAQAVKKVQYLTDMSIEQVAKKIGYTRPHLNRLMKEGDSPKLYDALQKEFGKMLQGVPEIGEKSKQESSDKLTTSTNKPVFDVKTNGSTSDKDTTISNLSSAAKSQQETIAKLTDNLIALTTKVIEKL